MSILCYMACMPYNVVCAKQFMFCTLYSISTRLLVFCNVQVTFAFKSVIPSYTSNPANNWVAHVKCATARIFHGYKTPRRWKMLVPSPLFHSSLLPDDFIFPWIMCSLKQFSTILVTLSDFNKQTPLFLNHLQYMCPCMARPYQICLFMILGVKQKTEHIIQQKWSLSSTPLLIKCSDCINT